MNLSTLTKQFADVKMPVFWQMYSLVTSLLVTVVFFLKNQTLENIIHPIIGLMICISITFGVLHKKIYKNYWYVFLFSIIFFEISITLQALWSLGFVIHPFAILTTKEVGMGLITSFLFSILLLIEKNMGLRGLIFDMAIIALGILFFSMIVNHDQLHPLISRLSIIQKVYLLNVVITVLLLFFGIAHIILSKQIPLKVIIVIAGICCFLIHFTLEFILAINVDINRQLFSRISWFFYQIIGGVGLIYIYLEDFNFSSHVAASRTSIVLMWLSSIVAVLAVPIAVLINWFEHTNISGYLLIGVSSFTLSCLIIYRFFSFVNNANKQRTLLLKIAFKDKLTGVLNYLGFTEYYTIKNSVLIIAINIEDFKSINDLYGRNIGDEVLKSLAKRLSQLENTELVARTGSDTFIIIYQLPKSKIQATINNIQEYLGSWDYVADIRIAVPLTYGASYNYDPIDADTLSVQAEKALGIARSKHINYHLYDNCCNQSLVPRQELRGILQRAVDDNFLPIHFQPIYNLKDGSLKALELLIRVHSNKHGLLLPGQFLEQAQAYGLLTSLTKVCVNMIAKYYEQLPDVVVNINLPPYMLDNPSVLGEFLDTFREANLSPERFCIEILEDNDFPMDNLLNSVKSLKQMGFAIAMDDFGTGYSSLTRLSTLPFDTVKIDRSLLLSASTGNKVILESTINLIKELGLAVVVEGVETLEQLALVKNLGADSVQGFLFSKPVDVSKVSSLPLTLET